MSRGADLRRALIGSLYGASALVFLGLCACAPAVGVPSVAGVADAWELRRGPCGGRCPSYTLRIERNGQFELRYEARPGGRGGLAPRAGRLSEAQLSALRAATEAAVDQRAPTQLFLPGQPGCGSWSTDQATLDLELRWQGRDYRFRHYLGCAAAPVALLRLEGLIEAQTAAGGAPRS